MKKRIAGVLMLLGAWWIYHAAIHVPLQQMKAHAPEIKEWMKAVVILPILIGMGLSHLVLGEEVEDVPAGVSAIAAVLLLALGVWWLVWFEHQVDIYGYGGHPRATAPLLANPVPFAGVIPNPPPQDVAAPPVAPPRLPTQELHDVFAAADGTGEAQFIMLPSERMRRSLPSIQITDPLRVVVKRIEYLSPVGCSRYHVTLQQGGDVMQAPGESKFLRPYNLNISYSLNYCLDRTIPVRGYDIQVES